MKALFLAPLAPLAALSAAALPAPASAASVFDYGVYAAGKATLTGGSYGRVAAGALSATGGATVSASAASAAALTADAARLSAELGARAATGQVARATLPIVGLTGITLLDAGTGVNMFNLSADDFSHANLLTFAGLGTGAVINVAGKTVTADGGLGLALNLGLLDPGNVVFNFYEATAVSLRNVTLGGSVLAPNALVSLNGGGALGSVVASDLTAAGASVGGRGYLGLRIDAPAPAAPVPEAATWAAMTLGLGAVGYATRRRRARVLLAA